MALSLLFPGQSQAKIGTLPLDASLRESHKFSSKITSFPVENGADITDNILINPKQLTIEGFITDTPVKYLAGIRDALSAASGSGSPSKSAFETLQKIQESRTLITIVTGLKTYENMAIESIEFPRDPKTGQTLRFSISLKEVILTTFIETNLTTDQLKDVNGSKDQASPQVDAGKQQTTTPTDSEKETGSILFNVAKSWGFF